MRLKEQASLVAVIVLLFLTCSCGKGGNGPTTDRWRDRKGREEWRHGTGYARTAAVFIEVY